jgi:signal recognition particle receptor subunit beta
MSQSGGVSVEGLGAEGEGSDMGGLECSGPGGATFRFADWEGGEVCFIGSSVRAGKGAEVVSDKTEGDGLLTLREWLHEIL